MPAGKGRRLTGRAPSGFFDQGFSARLWAAASKGVGAIARLDARRAAWLGQAEALPRVERLQPVRKLFSWPPFARARDPIADHQADIMADLEAVAAGRPMASPEIAQARTEVAASRPGAAIRPGVAA